MKSQRGTSTNQNTSSSLRFFFSTDNPCFALLSFAATLASQFSEADASLVVNKGIPEGGQDKCDTLSYCTQSYITDGAVVVSQVFQSIVQATSKSSLGALWQLSNCLTMDKVDTALLSALLKNATSRNTTVNCASSSLQFLGYQAATTATNLTAEQCGNFQSNYQTVATECLDTSKAYGLDAAIVFILLGAVCFLCCAMAAGCMFKESLTEKRPDNHIGMDMVDRYLQKPSS